MRHAVVRPLSEKQLMNCIVTLLWSRREQIRRTTAIFPSTTATKDSDFQNLDQNQDNLSNSPLIDVSPCFSLLPMATPVID